MPDLIDRAALWAQLRDDAPTDWLELLQGIIFDQPADAAPRAATEPLTPGTSNDIKLVANAILGSTSYLPHREAAERLLAAPRAATEPPPREVEAVQVLGRRIIGWACPECGTAVSTILPDSFLTALATPPSAPLEETRG